MPLTRVQSAPKGSTSNPAACTFSSPPAVGNAILVVGIGYGVLNPTFVPPTDNYGNPYTYAIHRINSSPHVIIHFCPCIGFTGSSFTITSINPGYVSAVEIDMSGQVLCLDKTATNTGSSATPSTGTTAAITGSDCVGAAGFSIEAGQASIAVASVSPAWIEDFENLVFFGSTGEADDRLLNGVSGSTQSCSWTCATSANWASAIAIFRASTIGGGGGGGEVSIASIG